MQHRIEERPDFGVLGYTLRTTTVGGQNMREIPKFWDRCLADGKVQQLDSVAGDLGTLGLCADYDGAMEAFTYVIGVEERPGIQVPPGCKLVQVPAASWAVFSCVGAMPHAIQDGWRHIMSQWLPGSGYVKSGPLSFERYPVFPPGDERGDPTSPTCYTEIWIPVRKK